MINKVEPLFIKEIFKLLFVESVMFSDISLFSNLKIMKQAPMDFSSRAHVHLPLMILK